MTLEDITDALDMAIEQAEGDYWFARELLIAPQTRSALNQLRAKNVQLWCSYEDQLAEIARGWGLPITPTKEPLR